MRAHLGLGVLVVFVGAAAALHAGETKKPAAAPVRERTFTFEMRGKPWAAVFEWLTDQSGIPFVSRYPAPTGTFHFIAKAGQRYTLGELIDLINDGLVAHKYVLIRSPTCFRLVPADERIDKALVPTIRVDELPARGRSEIVEVVMPLLFLSAEEYAGEVKKLLGPFGEVVALRSGNRLLLCDTARSLERIVSLTKEVEEAETRVIAVDGYSAARVAELLRRMVPELRNHPVQMKPLPGQ